jgi:multisubunit Na+/H+ antiporter MnhG subunit
MAFSVGSIVGDLVLKDNFTAPLAKGTKAADTATKSLTKTFAIVGAAATAAAGAILAAANATANYRDETTKAARAAGVSTETFSQMRHAAELSGVSMETLAGAFSKLQTTGASKELSNIGVQLTKSNGEAKDNADIFDEIADKVKKAGTATEKTRIAVAAFGRSGGKMVSMLENGSEGLAEMRQEAIDLGIAFDENSGRQAEKWNDDFDRLKKSVQGVRDSFSAVVIEMVNGAGELNIITETIKKITKWFNNLDEDTKKIIVGAALLVVGIGLLIGALTVMVAIAPAVGAAITVMMGPVGLAILAMAALAAGIAFVVVKWDDIMASMGGSQAVFGPIKDAFSEIKEAMASLADFDDVFDGLFGDNALQDIDFVGLAIKAVALSVNDLVSGIKVAMAVFKGIIQSAGNAIKLLKALKDGDFQIAGAIWDVQLQIAKDTGDEIVDIAKDNLAKRSQIWNSSVKKSEEVEKKINKNLTKKRKTTTGKHWIKELESTLNQVIGITSEIVSSAQNAMNASADFALARINKTIEQIDFFGERHMENMRSQHEDELELIESTEQAKVDAIRAGSVERMAIIDAEFLRKKELADAEFAAFVERERIEFELKLDKLERDSADSEQARLARQVMEADWRKHLENLEKGHQKNLLNIESDSNEKKQEESKANNKKTAEAEANKAETIQAIKDAQADREKDTERKLLLAKALMEYKAFQINKANQIANARITLANTIMAAVQGGVRLAASFPPASIPFGYAFGAAQSAMAVAAYGSTIGAINSAQYIPPAGLFAEQGGLIQGPRHSSGGVNVNAEGGEVILSRGLTDRMDAMVTRDEQSRGALVQIQPGAFIVYGNMDESMVDRLSESVAQRIEQRRY